MTIIWFILILGIIVFVHELGHFIFAKRAGIYVYEFSLGMGPKVFQFKRKNKKKIINGKEKIIEDETVYSIRLFPIGGFVQLAGEDVEVDKNIPDNKRLQSKTWLQRFLTMIAGVTFNFILAIIILFIIGLVNGATFNTRYLDNIDYNKYPTLEVGDKILKINGRKVNTYDKLLLEIQVAGIKEFDMTVVHENGKKEDIKVTAVEVKDKDGNIKYDFGFQITGKEEKGLFAAIKYAFLKFFSTIEQMFFTLLYLFTGQISLNLLSGPVGLFGVVGDASNAGFMSVLSLLALFSINVGFINILPFPAFDGGRALFLIIEKIKGSPVNPKIENIIHNIGFYLLMLLMLYVTFNDILKLF